MSKFRANIFLIRTTSNYLRPQKFPKIRVFKVDYFILTIFLLPKLKSVAQNEWKKHPYIYILTFGSKINKLEQKKSGKKKFQKPKSCKQLP